MSAPMLDAETLAQLRVLELRRPGFLAKIVQRYLSESEMRMTALRTALEAGELSALMELAHSFKGDTRLIGAEPAALEVEKVERAARDNNVAECALALQSLADVLVPTCAALRALPECAQKA
jgi:HPt (histidine-containing phosphotransfer) domain-containing protein